MADDRRDEGAFGTAAPDAPVTRADFERALRNLNASDLELRDMLLRLAAQVVTLTDELTRRIDRVEPAPAAPATPAPAPTATIEHAVAAQLASTLEQVRARDEAARPRVALEPANDKYSVEPATPPCDELLHICKARCCTLSFPLSTQDLEEGVIRWDYGQPYLIRQRASDDYCVHSDPATHTCSVHSHRPRTCRTYDCREDPRVWTDYATRTLAPPLPTHVLRGAPHPAVDTFELLDRVRQRALAVDLEMRTLDHSYADPAPTHGPRAAEIAKK